MQKPIAILGSGPAGLLAAHAAGDIMGNPLAIFSLSGQSRLGGAQFLHSEIPGLTSKEPDLTVRYEVRGDAATYRRKVYRDDPVPFVSFEGRETGQTQPAWNLSKAYDELWSRFGHSINHEEISAGWIEDHARDFSAILSTVPLVHICRARAGLLPEVHRFKVQRIYVHPDTLEPIEDNTILYEGTDDRTWYRSSNIAGHRWTEWSDHARRPPGLEPFFKDEKPISTTCDCFPEVVRLGRRGQWKKGVLAHHAFIGTLQYLRTGEKP